MEKKMTEQRPAFDQRRTVRVIIAVALMGFAGIMSETSLNVTFTKLMGELHVSMGTISWLTTGYLLAVAIVMTLSSYLKAAFDEKKLYLVSVVLFTIGTIIGGFAPNFAILLGARFLQGIAAGLALPLMFNIIIERIPPQHIGMWMGIGGMILSIAPSIGPSFGGAMIDTLGWRAIFFTTLILPVVSLIIGLPNFDKQADRPAVEPFDFAAFTLLAVSLTSLLLVVNALEQGQINWALLALFIVTMVAFVYRSLHSTKRFLNLRILTKPAFVFAIIPYVLYQFANIGGNFLIPTYLQEGFGVSSFLAGFALLPGTLLGAFSNPQFGRLYDTKGPKLPLTLGNGLFLIALLGMSLTTGFMGFIGMVIFYIIFSLGRVMAFGATNTTAVDHLPKEEKSDALAMLQTSQQFAGALGTALVALLASSAPDVKVGMNWTFLLFLGFAIVAYVLFGLMFKTKEYQD
jgi:EmrB/QacA subfamily drug resistance transporter